MRLQAAVLRPGIAGGSRQPSSGDRGRDEMIAASATNPVLRVWDAAKLTTIRAALAAVAYQGPQRRAAIEASRPDGAPRAVAGEEPSVLARRRPRPPHSREGT